MVWVGSPMTNRNQAVVQACAAQTLAIITGIHIMDGAQSKGISDAEATTASQTCDSFQKLTHLSFRKEDHVCPVYSQQNYYIKPLIPILR